MLSLQAMRSFKRKHPNALAALIIVALVTMGIFIGVVAWDYRIEHGLYGKLVADAQRESSEGTLRMRFFSDQVCVIDVREKGFAQRIAPSYFQHGDTIEFEKAPLEGVEERLLRKGDKLYFVLDDSGEYDDSSYLQVKLQPAP